MLTRRALLGAGAAAGTALAAPVLARGTPDTIVVGAGVFGAWTAEMLRRQGQRVLLVDAWGPAHARASSGGESRMTRAGYGADPLYARMAWDSLPEWKGLSARSTLPLFHQTGVLFFTRDPDYVRQNIDAHRALGLDTVALDNRALRRRYPQIAWNDGEIGFLEPQFGALMARRAVQSLVAAFVAGGGDYRIAAIAPPFPGRRLARLVTDSGERLSAARFVFACGPWLPKLFPNLLGPRIFPTRQEVFFFAPEAGDDRFGPAKLPGWADYNDGDIYYGFPDLEARGFKIAHDAHGPRIDPDANDRMPSAAALADARAYMERRFPDLRGRPLAEARVCQYENSATGDLLIDRHPRWDNVLLVGAGSGHGFKHGPAVGKRAADMLLGDRPQDEPRLSLATKGEDAQRQVH